MFQREDVWIFSFKASLNVATSCPPSPLSNMYHLCIYALYIFAVPIYSQTATLNLRCDNSGYTFLSLDYGVTWSWEFSYDDWTTTMTLDIPNPNASTIVRCFCIDDGSVGGFIATINYDDYNYSTTNPVGAQHWKLFWSSDNITDPLVYTEKTDAPWSITDSSFAPDAYWIWNGQTLNTMVFQFEFASVGTSRTRCRNRERKRIWFPYTLYIAHCRLTVVPLRWESVLLMISIYSIITDDT